MITIHVAIGNLELSKWGEHKRATAHPLLLLCDVVDADALYAEYAAQGVEFTRGLGNMPWHKREFVVRDCDGRLLAFGANL